MRNKICFNKNYLLIFLFVVILILYVIVSYNLQNRCLSCVIEKSQQDGFENSDSNNIKKKSKDSEKKSKSTSNDEDDNYEDTKKDTTKSKKTEVKYIVNYPNAVIDRDPKMLNSLDRIYNPLKYPYKSDYYYDQSWYPNLQLPFQVIGGGYRNMPTIGGTQVPIYNPPVPINISTDTSAQINISTRGPLGQPQQVGIIYKVFGNDNDVLPLFGRKKYPNSSDYEYYTMMGQFGVKVPIIAKNRKDELGTNDIVFVKGRKDPYTVTIYPTDGAEYIPYI
jgi:hypothetical protein